MLKTYQGGCHCGAVRYQADIDLTQGTTKCNCSICKKTRYWGAVIKPDAFRLQTDEAQLADYQFGSQQGRQLFCKSCGLRSFSRGNVPEIGGAFVSINIACLDGVSDEELASLPIRYCNGRDYDWRHEPKVTSYL